MGIFTKIINYNYNICEEDAELEVELQIISSRYHFSPKIIETYFGEEHCNITMENLETLNLADNYGENPEDIPLDIWTQIRYILTVLYEEEGIEYIDITPYNFIEKDGKVFIIDFGHAYYTDFNINGFLNEVMYHCLNEWNADFK